MQLQLAGTENQDGALIIHVSEGGMDIAVVRDVSGNYSCYALPCIWKKQTGTCEHVHFAREKHDTVIAPSEEAKAQAKLRLAEAKLVEARAAVDRIEGTIPSKNPPVLAGAARRIRIEEE